MSMKKMVRKVLFLNDLDKAGFVCHPLRAMMSQVKNEIINLILNDPKDLTEENKKLAHQYCKENSYFMDGNYSNN